MADACLEPIALRAMAIREHELRKRLALALRSLRQISRASDQLSFEANAPEDVSPHQVIGWINCVTDSTIPAAAGVEGFSRIRWQINRQTHRSRRRDQVEQQLASAAYQE